MAIIAPGLLALIFLGIQGALLFYGRNVAIQSAREGVSLARVLPDQTAFEASKGAVQTRTERFASEIGRESLMGARATVEFNGADAVDGGGQVHVEVTGTVITLIPGIHLTVTGSADGAVERWDIED